jgi:hypothetical protein
MVQLSVIRVALEGSVAVRWGVVGEIDRTNTDVNRLLVNYLLYFLLIIHVVVGHSVFLLDLEQISFCTDGIVLILWSIRMCSFKWHSFSLRDQVHRRKQVSSKTSVTLFVTFDNELLR